MWERVTKYGTSSERSLPAAEIARIKVILTLINSIITLKLLNARTLKNFEQVLVNVSKSKYLESLGTL